MLLVDYFIKSKFNIKDKSVILCGTLAIIEKNNNSYWLHAVI